MKPPKLKRDRHGIPHIEAADEAALFFGQGMAHATDRALQMVLMRIVGQGRVSEVLDSSDASLRVDRFFRRANWFGHAQSALAELSVTERSLLDAYCQGVNHVLARHVPWELKLCRHCPEVWKPEDTVMLLRMLGYFL
jgi:penicillin amidase